MNAAEYFWKGFNAVLQLEGLTQQFSVDSVTGEYRYPVPRNEEEADIFRRILNTEKAENRRVTLQRPDRYYHFP
jgi:hypothetical protein